MCLDCKHRSVTFEAFMYLSLPIPPGTRRYTLQVGVAVGGMATSGCGNEAFMYLSLPISPGTRWYTLQVGVAVGGVATSGCGDL